MPIKTCREIGKSGYKCGDEGKCYTYTSGNETSRKQAKRKAIEQCIAIGEPVSEGDLQDAGMSEGSKHPTPKNPDEKKKKKKRKVRRA